MNDSDYKGIEHRERVVFKGKVKLNPRSKDAEIVDCYVTEGSVVIESTEPLRIPLDRIEDCSVSIPTSYVDLYRDLAKAQSTPGTIMLKYRDASGQRRTTQFETSAFDALGFSQTLTTARGRLLRVRRWREAWSRGLACPTQPAAKLVQPYLSFFHTIKEKLRNKTGDRLCAELCAMGLNARMAEWGELKQDMFLYDMPGSSLGLIEIQHSPIRLVNVRKRGGDQYTPDVYSKLYLVPDPSVWAKGYAQVEAKFVRAKSGPLKGRVADIHWKSYFEDDFLRRLEQDVSLKQALIRLGQEIRVERRQEWGCWVIWSPGEEYRLSAPSREEWDCYQMIARRLLELGEK